MRGAGLANDVSQPCAQVNTSWPHHGNHLRASLPASRTGVCCSTYQTRTPSEPHCLRPDVNLPPEQANGAAHALKLVAIGVRPDAQGQGLGAAILEAINEDADAQGLPLYLEADHEGLVPLYQRHGYQRREQLTVIPPSSTHAGWEVPLMLRPARTAVRALA